MPLWRHFSGAKWNGIPYYIKTICQETKRLIKESQLSQEEIWCFIAKGDQSYFYVIQNILLYGISIKLDYIERYTIATGEASLPNEIVVDEDILSCAVVCFVLDGYRYKEWDFEVIVPNEQFAYSITDFKLTKVSGVDFRQSGFIYDDKYYLYTIFIDKKPIEFFDKMPAVFQLISDNIDLGSADLYLRLDERLAVPLGISNLGMAIAGTMRSDLQAKYIKYIADDMRYCKEGVDILIDNGWLEQPPQAVKHENLVWV